MALTRDLTAEQNFVKSWGGKGGALPTSQQINMGVYKTATPTFGTAPTGPMATLAKSATERKQVVVGSQMEKDLFKQGYGLEQKIPNVGEIPNYNQTFKTGSSLYGVKIPEKLPTDTLNQTDKTFSDSLTANLNEKGSEAADINNFQSRLQEARKDVYDAGQPTQEIKDLGTQLADVQDKGVKFGLETQSLQSAEDFNPNKLTSQIGKSQAQIERERSFKSQEYKLDESNLINRLGLAQDAQKTAIDAAKFGYTSLLDDANLAFKVQERVDQQNQIAFQQAQTLQGAALQKATLAMNAFKEGLTSGQDASALKASLGLLLGQAGIDPKISASMFDAIQSGVEYDRLKDSTANNKPDVSVIGTELDEFGNQKNVYGYYDAVSKSFKRLNYDGSTSPTTDNGAGGIEGFDYQSFLGSISGGTQTQGFDTPVSYFKGRTTHGGYDIAGKENEPVKAPVSGKVVEITKDDGKGTGWGNSVVIQDAQGNKWRLGHFNQVTVGMGENVSTSQAIGYLGNTGKVIKGEGGNGVHLHLEAMDKNGKLIDIGKQQTASTTNKSASQIAKDIMSPNSSLTLAGVPIKQRASVSTELNKLKDEAIKTNNILGIIKASAGGQPTSDTFTQSFEKGLNVLSQLSDLQNTISDQSTGPILGIIRSNNPYDKKAQLIAAQLQAIVPNLARGVYGEVGVLTDNDIKNYSQTLPNLKSTEDVRNLILGMTVKSVSRSLENKIKTQAALGRDVSGTADIYNQVTTTADELIGKKTSADSDWNDIESPQKTPSGGFWAGIFDSIFN